ncbi:U3 small nucleolar RNA-associated protein 14 (UTP14) [Vairimorpha necatrix]|uniref:U3 small nucleolar RNA-associated protein 14 (UTP14) n=1 Tax=Vairimorpha necatrix TaxID=6039 RepID=A0AAX4J8L3_9MICR
MSNKLTIDDFLKDETIEVVDTKKPLIKNNREEINHFISTKEQRLEISENKPSFYDIVPKTKLESVINKILNKNNETKIEKTRRLNFQHNFDTKMRRIKRIKSKSYRKAKRLAKSELEQENEYNELGKKLQIPLEEEKEEEIEQEENIEDAPIFNFTENQDDSNQHEIVKLAFEEDMEENEEEFIKEKEEIINENTPKIIETILPGWGDWAGPGLEIIKTKHNTIIETKEGINYAQRKDFGSSHVIINEENNEVEEKYKSNLPFGYTKEDYKIKLSVPVSKECNTTRMYKKILSDVIYNKSGENIEPFKYEPEN